MCGVGVWGGYMGWVYEVGIWGEGGVGVLGGCIGWVEEWVCG